MPIIDGIKMACVPCIRGHRSTKCNHASERVMVPVRKPGRPLSICPHPSSKPCACGVTAAIPKKPNCPCSPSDSKAQPSANKSAAAAVPVPAPTPAPGSGPAAHNNLAHLSTSQLPTQLRPANGASPPVKPISAPGSGRIQKAQPPKSTRKHSFDPSILQRIDVSNANIVSPPLAFDSSPQTQTHMMQPQLPSQMQPPSHLQSPLSYSPNPMLSGPTPQITVPMMMPVYLPTMSSNIMGQVPGHVAGSPSASPTTFIPSSHVSAQHTVKLEPGLGSHEQAVSSASPSPSEPTAPKKSCCSGGGAAKKASTPVANGKPAVVTIPASMPPNATPPTTADAASAMHMNAFYSPFSYPPQMGSLMQPLNPDQWRAFMDSYIASQAHGTPGSGQPETPTQSQQQTRTQPQTQPPILGSTFGGMPVQQHHLPQPQHQQPAQPLYHVPPPPPDTQPCTCGDTCQCLGCWWHPYNQTTTDQVMSAYNAMWGDSMFDSDAVPTPTSAIKSPVVSAGGTTGAGGNGGSCCAGDSATATGAGGTHSTQSHSPVSAGGSAVEEQNLSADTFLFVHYPIHGTCLGESVTCPCGDDCECLGCVVHGN
ncbi:hypothetical protein BROUX41_006199 [Berkeleyomyces rouxiae]|uniref:uncharacterized protein n=1 Tax=Berkeleyomyces rouxiae TaxID=2035830 RepID=UPI003B788922